MVLVEAADRVLPPYPPDLSQKAQRQLERLGVEVRTNARVTGVDADGVWLGDERLAARTIVWAAGVAASPLGRALGAPVDRAGRVPVAAGPHLPGHPEVFVIGDLAAMRAGRAAGARRRARGHADGTARGAQRPAHARGPRAPPFRYVDKGSLATIGRKSGVALFGRFRMSGFPAWAAWLAVHIFFLIGFRNRLVVMTDWAWSYFTHQRFARLHPGSGAARPVTGPQGRGSST